MKGKVGLVVGLAAGYVLGSRAGRERFEQIKEQWLKVYESDQVQKQVEKVKDLSKDAAAALPSTLWTGAVKVTKAATGKGDTAGQRLDKAMAEGKKSADDVAKAATTGANEVGDAAEDAFDDIQKAARDHDGV